MNELALFAGAGGGILGGHLLGWRTICAVEYDPYSAAVLVQRQNDGLLPPFPIWDDVRTFDGKPWRGCVDVVSGGFPCQAFSSAASGRNVAENLWPEMRRIVGDVAPSWVFAENVTERAIDKAADDLEAMGYNVRCTKMSAADMGADHVRQRYWLVAHSDHQGELRQPINAKMGSLSCFRSSFWETFAAEPRVADGMAHRMDRLAATGNGQVPVVAATAFIFLAAK